MRYAISTDNGSVSAHFGRCQSFTIIDADAGNLVAKEVIPNPGHEPGRIPQFLHEHGVHVIVAGGMGVKAQGFFAEYGIGWILGVGGNIDDIVSLILSDSLEGGASTCKPQHLGLGFGGDETHECEHK